MPRRFDPEVFSRLGVHVQFEIDWSQKNELAILGSPNSWYFKDLSRACEDRHEIVCLPFSRLMSNTMPGETNISSRGVSLDSFDAVIVRSMPAGSLEQVVFRMDALQHLEQSGTKVLNPPKSLEIAIDKFLTLAKLQRSGLNVPRTIVCQTVEESMEAFITFDSDVVVKPIFGGEGRGITRISDEAIALRVFKSLVQTQAVIYLQEFIDHVGYDIRLLTVGEQVLGMKRCNDSDWRTNITLGGRGEPIEVTDELAEHALKVARIIGAPLLGVDVLPAQDGTFYTIEANAVPGWRGLSKTLNLDVSRLVIELLET